MSRILKNFLSLRDRADIPRETGSITVNPGVMTRGLTGVALAAVVGLFLASSQAAAAAPIACGGAYTAVKGDTLFKIAVRAYGDGWRYKALFAANRDLLPDEKSLEVDAQILIPCLDGSGPATRRDAVARGLIVDQAEADASRSPIPETDGSRAHFEAEDDGGTLLQAAARIAVKVILPGRGIVSPTFADRNAGLASGESRLVTGSGFAPYADAALPGGGIITDLVSRAFEAAAPDQPYRVSFVNDWASHLEVHLPDDAFEIGFPWFKPDCSRSAGLNDALQRVCASFAFSRPIYEVKIGYYARIDDPLAGVTPLSALSGKRLCRPNGHFTFDLEQIGLVAPNVILETNLTAEKCFARLAAGEVDVVTMSKPEGDAEMRRLGLAGAAAEIAGMRTVQSLHAIAPKSNPEALAALELVNRGIDEMMRSGRWFKIVSSHQAHYLSRLTGL